MQVDQDEGIQKSQAEQQNQAEEETENAGTETKVCIQYWYRNVMLLPLDLAQYSQSYLSSWLQYMRLYLEEYSPIVMVKLGIVP